VENPTVLGVIPVRLESTRLPRKPLHPILGRPLLEWVWRRVSGMKLFDRVVVAADAPEIKTLCESIGAPVVMTDVGHPSGTDRVAQVVGRGEFRDFSLIVNVQGDEPLVAEEHLKAAVDLVRGGMWDVGTCATPLVHSEALKDPSVVKVARAADGRALYFSRAPIPFKRDAEVSSEDLSRAPYLRHVGIYVYRRDALTRWVRLPPSPLEKLERLEQLRALEDGMEIGVALVGDAARGVDTLEDAAHVERLLEASGARVPEKTWRATVSS
jgi:3-deoxy-manno-octulosonate cytidylyltransferase (CMP-KDO synthetase)